METTRKVSKKPPVLPELQKIDNDLIVLEPDFYFRKRYEDIVEAASELPLVLEYINESLQRASIAAFSKKRELTVIEAETYMKTRQGWDTTYSDKMTEKAVEMAVAQNEDLNQAYEDYSVLKSYVNRLANMQENLRSKLDALRSVEATKRKMISDDPDN